jgi:hypothetical protein
MLGMLTRFGYCVTYVVRYATHRYVKFSVDLREGKLSGHF